MPRALGVVFLACAGLVGTALPSPARAEPRGRFHAAPGWAAHRTALPAVRSADRVSLVPRRRFHNAFRVHARFSCGPAYLERWAAPSIVLVQEPLPADFAIPPAIPSLTDLPTVAGIFEASVAEPQNLEPNGTARWSRTAGAGRQGPRVIVWAPDIAEPASGRAVARIVPMDHMGPAAE